MSEGELFENFKLFLYNDYKGRCQTQKHKKDFIAMPVHRSPGFARTEGGRFAQCSTRFLFKRGPQIEIVFNSPSIICCRVE
jgi:hypothetical protein